MVARHSLLLIRKVLRNSGVSVHEDCRENTALNLPQLSPRQRVEEKVISILEAHVLYVKAQKDDKTAALGCLSARRTYCAIYYSGVIYK